MNSVAEIDPYVDDPVGQRLARLEIPTPDSMRWLATGQVQVRPRPGARARRLRRAVALGAMAAVTATASVIAVDVVGVGRAAPVTVHIPGFTVVVAAAGAPVAPRTSREQATASAIAWLAQHPVVSTHQGAFAGFSVTTVTFFASVLKVWEQCGAHWFLPSAENLWVIDLRAPAQLGSAYVRAAVLVDDSTGMVRYADALTGPAGPNGC
jgi:hypothetical protein